jgi:hypothetical protein
VPEGQAAPKGADSELGQTCWRTSWLPATGRQGSVVPQEERRRDLGVLKWLTYAKNAVRMDAEIGMKVVEHLLGVFTAARLRHDVPATRCADCGSYRVVGGVCEHCNGVAPRARRWTKAERTRRLAEPCTRVLSPACFRDGIFGFGRDACGRVSRSGPSARVV